MNKLICWHANYSLELNDDGQSVKACNDCGAICDPLGVWPVVDVLSEWPQVIEEKE